MKQDCEICQQWMEEAFVGELTPPLQKSLSEHLENCSDCQNLWQEYQDLHRGMESLEKLEEPPEFTSARILKAAEKNSTSKQIHPIWKFLFSPVGMAAAMLVLIVGVGLYSHKWIQTHREEPALAPIAAPPVGSKLTPKKPLPEAKPLTNAPPPPAKEEENAAERYYKSKAILGLPAQAPALLSPQGGAGSSQAAQDQASQLSLKQTESPASLVASAKGKINIQDYAGALRDLLSAQKIEDTTEIRNLIAVCQKHLQP